VPPALSSPSSSPSPSPSLAMGPTAAPPGPASRGLSRLSLGLWGLVMALMGAVLLGRHLPALPLPTAEDPRIAAAAAAARPAEARGWVAYHVLFTDCDCSRGVAEALVGSPHLLGLSEQVLLVGEDDALEAALVASGRPVHHLSAGDLVDRWGVEAAPAAVVIDENNVVRAVSGYTDRKQAASVHWPELYHRAVAGEPPALPLYGCATSRRLRDRTHPWEALLGVLPSLGALPSLPSLVPPNPNRSTPHKENP
jgi:hypothetical protein